MINKNCHLYTNGLDGLEDWITIGDHTQLAFDVKITTATHEIGSSLKRSGKYVSKPVTIGRGCWIGMGAIILPGVNIGDGCVIGAGSVVNRDCEADCLYAGNPAKWIRRLD